MPLTMKAEMLRFAESHHRNGERRTADLLERAVEHISQLEEQITTLQDRDRRKSKRLERLSERETSSQIPG